MAEKTKFFEIVRGGNTQDDVFIAFVGDPGEEICFQPVCLTGQETASLMEEIGNWELVDAYDYKYEDLAYDDVSSGSGERIITDDLLVSFLQGSYTSDQVHGGYLIDEGHFAGVVLDLEYDSSFGMAWSRDRKFGILLTDGRKGGRTDSHYFHSSTEVSESSDSTYLLRKKEQEL